MGISNTSVYIFAFPQLCKCQVIQIVFLSGAMATRFITIDYDLFMCSEITLGSVISQASNLKLNVLMVACEVVIFFKIILTTAIIISDTVYRPAIIYNSHH